MYLKDLRPGMENVNLRVKLISLEKARKVETNYGVTHVIVEGQVEDDTSRMGLTVWNEKIDQLEGADIGNILELKNCFVTSFKGILSVNVGRESDIHF
jgi:replication factor A1